MMPSMPFYFHFTFVQCRIACFALASNIIKNWCGDIKEKPKIAPSLYTHAYQSGIYLCAGRTLARLVNDRPKHDRRMKWIACATCATEYIKLIATIDDRRS